ncbi:MAG TPA: peptide-methionine (S)-S-oxide reductase MsrA, partial [Tenuifilaceae bacterium]|nr:peptide-methionine (S)-S-oxide reductase MsrA [Tenuifilaceae bacterium]
MKAIYGFLLITISVFVIMGSTTGERDKMSNTHEVATLGGGCFWCVEAVFLRLKGVERVQSGYSGGTTPNPTYNDVTSGETGHAEVVQVHFNPQFISFSKLLEVFFKTHNPTTLNRQGADVGTQYRSVIFYHSEEQRLTATEIVAMLDKEAIWDDPIVTEILPFRSFYPAEDYHGNYFARNRNQPYCQ